MQKVGWRGATKENTPCGSSTKEQRSQTTFCAKTLRAAFLSSLSSVSSVAAARFGDAPPSPPWPKPKSIVAAPLVIFRQALSSSHAPRLNPAVPVVRPPPANRQASSEYIFSLWFVVVRSYSLWFGVGSLGGMKWSLPRKNRVYECRAAKNTAMIMPPKFTPATKDKVRHLLPHIVSLCLGGFSCVPHASEFRAPRSVASQALFHESSFAKLHVKGTSLHVGARICVRPLPTSDSPPKLHARFPTAEN